MEIHYYCLGCFRDLDGDEYYEEDDCPQIEWVYVDACEYCEDDLWEDDPVIIYGV